MTGSSHASPVRESGEEEGRQGSGVAASVQKEEEVKSGRWRYMGGMRGRRGVRKIFWRLQMVMRNWWEVDRARKRKRRGVVGETTACSSLSGDYPY
jgi:hypothetical protein